MKGRKGERSARLFFLLSTLSLRGVPTRGRDDEAVFDRGLAYRSKYILAEALREYVEGLVSRISMSSPCSWASTPVQVNTLSNRYRPDRYRPTHTP